VSSAASKVIGFIARTLRIQAPASGALPANGMEPYGADGA
jgi:hypothetical protein